MSRLILMIILMFLALPALAEESDKPWHSEVELGYVETGGNTQTQTLNAKGELIFEADVWRTTLKGAALSASDNQATTAEKYSASLQQDYKFSERGYVFGRFGFETDRFDGVSRRLSETVGYGRTLLKNSAIDWKFEIGAGSRQIHYTDSTKKSEAVGRSLTAVKWKINEASTLTQELKTEGGKNGFVSNSVTALQHKLNSRLSSKISYAVQHTSQVPVGTKKANTEMAVTLVWSY